MKSLKALCTGVMTLCVASLSLTSCYDDSALNAKMDELGKEVSELDARLQAVEALTAKLEALTARVDALYTLKFQVTTTNELQYSFDGGTTWVSTGIVLAKELECTCEMPEACKCVEVSLTDNGDSVTITVGDQEFTIEKPQEIVFEIRAGKVYFESEGTHKVAIKSSGIEDLSVLSAPKGWWAEIASDGLLEVTAPDYESTQSGGHRNDDWTEYIEVIATASASGYVKVHACGADGKCMVGKIAVEVVNRPLIVKAYSGNAYFTIAGTASYYNPTFFYGISTKATLESDLKPILDGMNQGNYDIYDNYLNSDGEVHVEVSVAELLGSEPKIGEEYVVWAVLESNNVLQYTMEEVVLSYYTPVKVTVSEVESERTAYNVTVNVEVLGADSYLAVAMPDDYCASEDDARYQAEQMVTAMAQGTYYGKLYKENYSGSALDIAADTRYSMTGNYTPASDVWVMILPLDGRSADEYTADDVVCTKFSTADLTSGGSINLTAKQVTEYMGEVYDYDIWDYVPALSSLTLILRSVSR